MGRGCSTHACKSVLVLPLPGSFSALVLTQTADVQAQPLLEEWIEEQVIKIDENKCAQLAQTCVRSVVRPSSVFAIHP